jgi:SpoVK/Ycf46/Vps4 family AAA+-type ATPase
MATSHNLKLCNTPSGFIASKIVENSAYHNNLTCANEAFFSTTIGDKKYIFKSTPLETINPKTIYLGLCHRLWLNLALDTMITVAEYKPKNVGIRNLAIKIKLYKKNADNKPLIFHENATIDLIKRYLRSHYFYGHQTYVIKMEEVYCILTVNTSSEGWIDIDTKVNIISEDEQIRIISSNFLRPEMFDPSFDFRDYGLGGLDKEMRKIFVETLSTRSISPSLVAALEIKHVKGVLLYGPPGTGKTLIARNLGKLLTTDEPIIVNGPELLNSYVGQSEKNIREVFKNAISDEAVYKEKSKLHIIIFDEIDAICRSRSSSGSTLSSVNDSMVNQLLSIIDGVKALSNIFIIAMTNRKDLLDPALLRAGRIEVHIKIKLPDVNGRIDILNIHTKKIRDNGLLSDFDVNAIAENTENFSGAELEGLVKKSISYAINEQLINKADKVNMEDIAVTMNHFNRAMQEIQPAFGADKSMFKRKVSKMVILPSIDVKLRVVHQFLKYSDFIQNQSMLIYGAKGVGKTSMCNIIASRSDIPYTKIISAANYITLMDHQKIEFLFNIIKEAELSPKSLIIIDDVDILLDYTVIDGRKCYCTKLYNALKAVLGYSLDIDKNMRVIATTGNLSLANELEESFDKYMFLDYLTIDEYKILVSKFNIDESYIMDSSQILTINQLLEYA